MKLPLPFLFQGRLITELTVKRPGTEAIADCKERMQNDDLYGGLAIFAAGSLLELVDDDGTAINDKATIKLAVNAMPYRSVEWLLLQAVIKTGLDDVIEGIYPCPRCKRDFIPADPDPDFDPADPEHNADDADRISKLKVVYLDKPREVDIDLTTPVNTTDAETDEVLESVTAVRLRDPVMDDMIRACRKVGISNDERFNAALNAECTVAVNGKKVDKKWKAEWGTWLYDRIDYADTKRIKTELRGYGVKATVERICRGCGRKWEAEVDTGSFFASGLAG